MGQSLDKSQQISEICSLNSGLKDYLLLQKKDFNVKSLLIGKKKLIQNREVLDEEKLLLFTLSLALNIKTIQSNNCNFNTAILISKIKENNTEEEEKYLNQQIHIVENINEGKRIFKKSKSESINDYETIDIKNNKSNFLTLDNSLEKNFLDNNAIDNTISNQKKNLQNLEISKINTNKTANQTNIMDEDFGFDDYLKSDTTRVKTKLKIDNYLTQFESSHSSKKEFNSKNPQNQVNNDKSFENSKNGSNNKVIKYEVKDIKKINIPKNNNTSKGNNFETNNSNSKSNFVQNQSKSKSKLMINTSNINNSSNMHAKSTTNKQNKIERKPVVNIKIDLRDIVREDIIDSYIQNTNSISNNSNIKPSVSPVNRYTRAPFTSKNNINQSTPSNTNFKAFVENCSNPNKKNFHLENPKKILHPTTFKKQNTATNINLAKSKDKNIKVKEELNENNFNTKNLEKSKGLINENYNSKNMNNKIKGQINKSEEISTENSKNNFKSNAIKKMVCLDISEDGDIIDNTKKNDYIFTPENKVKYQLKPKSTKIIKCEENNNSFGRENSASFN